MNGPVVLPRSIEETLAALQKTPEATILAGGTDLMVAVNAGTHRPESVVSLAQVTELRDWHRDGDDVVVGACVTYTEMEHGELAALVPALCQAARTVGSPQIRNAATIGGNLGTASPAGDTLPVLAALDAVIEIRGPSGTRSVPPARIVAPGVSWRAATVSSSDRGSATGPLGLPMRRQSTLRGGRCHGDHHHRRSPLCPK